MTTNKEQDNGNTDVELLQTYEDALRGVLNTSRLDIAKELAAEALDEDLEVVLNDTYGDDIDWVDADFAQDDLTLIFEDSEERY